jgi:hypothetical protein
MCSSTVLLLIRLREVLWPDPEPHSILPIPPHLVPGWLVLRRTPTISSLENPRGHSVLPSKCSLWFIRHLKQLTKFNLSNWFLGTSWRPGSHGKNHPLFTGCLARSESLAKPKLRQPCSAPRPQVNSSSYTDCSRFRSSTADGYKVT